MDSITSTQLRAELKKTLDHVSEGGITYITVAGRKIAALVPVDVAENFETIEDYYWSCRAKLANVGQTHVFQGPSHLSEPVFNELRKQLPLAGYTIVETTKNIKEEYPPNFPEIIGKLEKISERFTLSPDTEFPPVVVLMENRDLLLWRAKEVSHNKYDEISSILTRIRNRGRAYNVFLIEHINSVKPEIHRSAGLPHILYEPKYATGTIDYFSLLGTKKVAQRKCFTLVSELR